MLVSQVDDVLKPDVIKWSAFYEHRIKLGSVSYHHLLERFDYVDADIRSNVESDFPPRGLCGQVHAHLREVSSFHFIHQNTPTNKTSAGLWAWTSSRITQRNRSMNE
jgi:hypothetical protein